MEQGRVKRYCRRERQGLADEEADYREYARGTTGSGRGFGYEDLDEPDNTCSSSSSFSSKHDSGMKMAWDCITNSRIQVKKNGHMVAKVPVSLGLVGVVGSIFNRKLAWVGVLGLAGALSAGYCLELDLKRPH